MPSGLLYGDNFYFFRLNSGVLTCVDAKTGEPHYDGQKIKGMKMVYSSPVGANDHVYLTSREGVTKVIKVGPEYEEVATNQLDDTIDASAALVGDEIYLRGQKYLYCIAEQ